MEGQWRKSSYSDNGDANCVEIQMTSDGQFRIRDSKAPNGGVLEFSGAGRAAWMSTVKASKLDW